MKCRPGRGGGLLFTLQPLPTILSSKSFFSFSRPVHFHCVSAGLLILAPFTLGWARWAPDFWHYPCTLSCGIDLALLLLGMYCLMISRAVIGRGLWGLYGAGHNRPSNPTLVMPFGLIIINIADIIPVSRSCNLIIAACGQCISFYFSLKINIIPIFSTLFLHLYVVLVN